MTAGYSSACVVDQRNDMAHQAFTEEDTVEIILSKKWKRTCLCEHIFMSLIYLKMTFPFTNAICIFTVKTAAVYIHDANLLYCHEGAPLDQSLVAVEATGGQ